MRAVALEVHRDFCEVAIVEQGELRSGGRIETKPETLELFAQSLDVHDQVALEVTGNAWEIARIIEPMLATSLVDGQLLALGSPDFGRTRPHAPVLPRQPAERLLAHDRSSGRQHTAHSTSNAI